MNLGKMEFFKVIAFLSKNAASHIQGQLYISQNSPQFYPSLKDRFNIHFHILITWKDGGMDPTIYDLKLSGIPEKRCIKCIGK